MAGIKTEDGSILDENGNYVFISKEKFVADICIGSACFLCGQNKSPDAINDEHILPNWLLKKYALHNQTISLPNKTPFPYAQYKIPICIECNSLLGEKIEAPISSAFKSESDGIEDLANAGNLHILQQWLSLIFVKTHLKDKYLRNYRDRRKPDRKISDQLAYEFHEFHHTYCISRMVYSGAVADECSFGSLFIVPTEMDASPNGYDYIDSTMGFTLGIVIGEIGIISVFNDGGACTAALSNITGKIDAPLSRIQFRELVAHIACCNMHLSNRPTFSTFTDLHSTKNTFILSKTEDRPQFMKFDAKVFGKLMYRYTRCHIQKNKNIPKFFSKLKNGEISFLFDDNGNFITPNPRWRNG